MSVPRRSFFAALLAPIAALALPKAVEVATAKPIARKYTREDLIGKWGKEEAKSVRRWQEDDNVIIEDAMRMIGVLGIGESASQNDLELGQRAIHRMRVRMRDLDLVPEVNTLAINLMPYYGNLPHYGSFCNHDYWCDPNGIKMWPKLKIGDSINLRNPPRLKVDGWAEDTIKPGDKITIAGTYTVNPPTYDRVTS